MAAQTWIDGVEVSNLVLEGSVKRRLNRPAEATVRMDMYNSIGGAGSRLRVAFDGVLAFHGFILNCETQGEEDIGYTVYNAQDPMELWQWRPCRDYDGLTPGNFIDPYFLQDKITGPQIIESLLLASENPALIPDAAEGPLFITYGGFEGGGVDLSGAPPNWPMSIMEMTSLLTSTGELDVVLTPIDSGGAMAQVDAYNGDFGTDRRGSVFLDYGMGAFNVRSMRWNEDMTQVANKIQYFLGPKETVRRFPANITGDDPCLPGNLFGGGGVGGALPGRPNFDDPRLGTRRQTSQASYGVRMDVQVHDTQPVTRESPDGDPPPTIPCGDPVREVWRRLWQIESWIRAEPKDMVHMEPVRGFGVNAFGIGDLVTVRCGPQIRGGFEGGQRVYEYTTSWDADGVYVISEIVTSAQQEGGP